MNNNIYSYKTIATDVRTKIAVGACRFYASLSFCRSEEEARSFLRKVKEELTGATHHAYAYRLGVGEALLARCDDDGEPAGTAGSPMLAVLEKEDLTNVIVVGTRYFGGVKLGLGRLVRAYRSCAEAGVKAACICTRELNAKALLQTPYDCLGAVIREVEACGGKTLAFNYGQYVSLEILLPLKQIETIIERIASASRGQAEIKQIEKESA